MFDFGKEPVLPMGDKLFNYDPLHTSKSMFDGLFEELDGGLLKTLEKMFERRPHEERWVENYGALLERGYRLRRRFEPGCLDNLDGKLLFDPDLREGLLPVPVSGASRSLLVYLLYCSGILDRKCRRRCEGR